MNYITILAQKQYVKSTWWRSLAGRERMKNELIEDGNSEGMSQVMIDKFIEGKKNG